MTRAITKAQAIRRLNEAKQKVLRVRWGREQIPIRDRRRLDSVVDELIAIGKRIQ